MRSFSTTFSMCLPLIVSDGLLGVCSSSADAAGAGGSSEAGAGVTSRPALTKDLPSEPSPVGDGQRAYAHIVARV